MVLKLVGLDMSTCTKRVAVVLKEKNVPFEFVNTDFAKGEHKSPAFLKKQPFGQVPYIEDDGFILFESRAIAQYIATKYASQGTPLIPTDLKELALALQAASIESSNFDPSASGLVYEAVFKPAFGGGESDSAIIEKHKATLDAKLDAYEAILSKSKYLAGENITLADLYHLPYGSMLKVAGVTLLEDEKRPHVAAWWKDLTSRPTWQSVAGGVSSST